MLKLYKKLTMSFVPPKNFQEECVQAMKARHYPNYKDFYERYLAGEDFNYTDLRSMGYNFWETRNINVYIHHLHNDDYYSHALDWE